jgi:hypothetical protein
MVIPPTTRDPTNGCWIVSTTVGIVSPDYSSMFKPDFSPEAGGPDSCDEKEEESAHAMEIASWKWVLTL